MLGHFVSYMPMLGHAGERAPRRDSRYRMFHVKHTQGESSSHTCVDITEPQYVGLRCNRSPNMILISSKSQHERKYYFNTFTVYFPLAGLPRRSNGFGSWRLKVGRVLRVMIEVVLSSGI